MPVKTSPFTISFAIPLEKEKERQLKNEKYDEAVDISQSLDDRTNYGAGDKSSSRNHDEKGSDSRTMSKASEQTKSQSVLNKPFDEALEFSQSGSDESVDTRASQKKKPEPKSSAQILSSAPTKSNMQTPAALVR